MMHNDFIEAGHRIFGLYGADAEGNCECGNPDCKAPFKHPRFSNWQHTPEWSEEQLEVMEMAGQLDTGYGVLVRGLLVVDVDARNGGVASFAKLAQAIPEIAGCGFIVATGSGNGSKHLYFLVDASTPLVQHLDDYPGIDFKSSGFVVGPGSQHSSGSRYEAVVGAPYDIEQAPEALLALLKKPDTYRAVVDGSHMDVSDAQIADMLSYINADCDHETWIRCGMAVHHATGGAGFGIWDGWSQSSAAGKYPGPDALSRRWHSFGKSANPVTLGTLVHYAEQAGWSAPVIFECSVEFVQDNEPSGDMPISIDGVDLLRPPGFVGEVVKWLNTQGISLRENIAVATALTAIGNVCGLRYREDLTNVTLNLFCFCVAGSGSGKEAMLSGFGKVHIAAGLGAAVHGNFKSEQELISNIIHHQAAFYAVDEIGTVLSKVENARKRGGAAYLDGLVGQLMSIYSKASGNFLLTGDRKREVNEMLVREYAMLSKKVEENEDPDGRCARQMPLVLQQINDVEHRGIVNPFLSMIGFTTPETFNELVTPEFVKNGFMSRALFFEEPDNNPKPRGFFVAPAMPKDMENTIRALSSGGSFDVQESNRIAHHGERPTILTTEPAKEVLERVSEYFWQLGEQYKESNGFEAITRRGYELTSKVSAILAAPEGVRTPEHVRWAFALVVRDLDIKAKLAFSNDASNKDSDRTMARIMTRISQEHGETSAVLANRTKTDREKVEGALAELEKKGLVLKKEEKNYRRTTVKWYLA